MRCDCDVTNRLKSLMNVGGFLCKYMFSALKLNRFIVFDEYFLDALIHNYIINIKQYLLVCKARMTLIALEKL